MRILVVADIHANWPALEVVAQEPFDVCICLGDLVDYGPHGKECVEWVRERASFVIRGNHDHGVGHFVDQPAEDGYPYLSWATRQLMWRQLRSDQLVYLRRLPVRLDLNLEELHLHLVHATPFDPLEEYLGAEPELWRRRLRGVQARIVCVGHTHVPFVLDLGSTIVLNPGSVGQPRDGDPRASFAIIEDGRIEIRRVQYPVDATISDLNQALLPERARDLAVRVLRNGGLRATPSPLLQRL
jgi:putative phosphoesterase